MAEKKDPEESAHWILSSPSHRPANRPYPSHLHSSVLEVPVAALPAGREAAVPSAAYDYDRFWVAVPAVAAEFEVASESGAVLAGTVAAVVEAAVAEVGKVAGESSSAADVVSKVVAGRGVVVGAVVAGEPCVEVLPGIAVAAAASASAMAGVDLTATVVVGGGCSGAVGRDAAAPGGPGVTKMPDAVGADVPYSNHAAPTGSLAQTSSTRDSAAVAAASAAGAPDVAVLKHCGLAGQVPSGSRWERCH